MTQDDERRSRTRVRAPVNDPRGARPVRKVRSEHGTRVARAVLCSRCGAKDMIHFAPRDPARALCRKCAADLLGADDPDTQVATPFRFECAACGRPAELPRRPNKEDVQLLCKDCFLGIESRQENKTREGQRVSRRVVRVRREEDEKT